ncbi:MAG: type II toxin-antitoxin system RatA family toxin [Dichotomicrobium sp.]
MKNFQTTRRVAHTADDMFRLVADVERYPEFVPLCERLVLRDRRPTDHGEVLVADMTVAYRFLRESFVTRVQLEPVPRRILVEYVDGPFKYLENRWSFTPATKGSCDISFDLTYEFRSRALQMLMGQMFDRAFSKFVTAFERRADEVYGRAGHARTASA